MSITRTFSQKALIRNRVRFREEVTEGIRDLLATNRHTQAWLARRLEKTPAGISKMLEGSNNFEIDSLADLSLALNRAVHIVFGVDTDEMRLAIDEATVQTTDGSITTTATTLESEPGSYNFLQHLRRVQDESEVTSTNVVALDVAPHAEAMSV